MGSSNSTVTQYTQSIPASLEPSAGRLLGQTEALASQPTPQYTGERIAQFTPMQQQAFQGAQTLGPSGATMYAQGLAGLAANNSFINPGVANSYMSPYMQNVVDIQQREAQRQADIAGTQRNAQAVKAGAFGGSRQAITNAEAARNLATQKGDIQAQGLQAAYQQAQNQFNAEQGQRMQGAQVLGGLGQQEYGQQQGAIQLQNQLGTAQQQQVQGGLDTAYNDWLQQTGDPYKRLQFWSDILHGQGSLAQTNSVYQQTPQPSALSQVAGLGMGAYGLSKLAAGGSVPAGLADLAIYNMAP